MDASYSGPGTGPRGWGQAGRRLGSEEVPVIVSLLRERRPGELRVLLLPQDAAQLSEICDLQVETGAGYGLGVADDAYLRAGARITSTQDAWSSADFLLKLKAPTVEEVRRIRCGGSIAALFHAEGTPDVVAELVARQITAYSFEYVQDDDGVFPLMAATGEIAGQMAVIYAAYHLQSHLDGSGISLPACAHVPAARVAVIGYGNAGRAAAKTALALDAEVTVYVRHPARSGEPAAGMVPKFRLLSEPGAADGLAQSDVIIGALRISTFDTSPVVTATPVSAPPSSTASPSAATSSRPAPTPTAWPAPAQPSKPDPDKRPCPAPPSRPPTPSSWPSSCSSSLAGSPQTPPRCPRHCWPTSAIPPTG
jgi:Alanine dehydrogenase/PNT, N-terminal domain/Alanine dehydrogenase/PNT, C-terminal domain